ncbi:hypothetical protein HBB16_04285 [Pseudonocardia sp. MCCB 268]|nr:hypothetical protein [Pseudonocardia cytotoxica]
MLPTRRALVGSGTPWWAHRLTRFFPPRSWPLCCLMRWTGQFIDDTTAVAAPAPHRAARPSGPGAAVLVAPDGLGSRSANPPVPGFALRAGPRNRAAPI